MSTLIQLIEKHGTPDAIIDHWDKNSKQYAIWGFEEVVYINNVGEVIINNNSIEDINLSSLQKILNTGDF